MKDVGAGRIFRRMQALGTRSGVLRRAHTGRAAALTRGAGAAALAAPTRAAALAAWTPAAALTTLALAMALAVAMPNPAAAQDVGLPLGSTPPAAVVQDLNGDSVSLARYVGRTPVLLEFWATWCPLCRAMEPRLRAAHQKYDDVQFLFIGVAVNQSPRTIRRHLEKDPLPGTVLWDADGAAVRAYDAPTTSYIVILDRSGKVAYTGTGSDQDVDGAMAKVAGGGGSGRRR